MRRLALLSLLAIAACNRGPTDPVDDRPRGLLFGTVTIGPNCPVEPPEGCPPPLDAYKVRKVLSYDEAKTRLIFTVDINSQGGYQAILLTGNYTVDLQGVGMDRSRDVPAVVTIHANRETRLDINIDTGLR